MIACSILCTVVVFIAGVWGLYHSALSKSRNMLVAGSLARSVLEQRVSQGYAALDGVLGVPQTVTLHSHSQIRGRQLDTPFEVEFLASNTATAGVRKLVVTLKWSDSPGERKLRYETYLFRTQ